MPLIHLEKKTKNELMKIIRQMQALRNEKVDYSSAIALLIDQYSTKKDRERFRNACKKINGIDAETTLKGLY